MSGFLVIPGEVEIPFILKDPTAYLDYWFDLGSWLQTGETATAAAWTLATGLVQDTQVIQGNLLRIWLRGGTVNTDALVTCHWTTTAGRQDSRSFVLKIRLR